MGVGVGNRLDTKKKKRGLNEHQVRNGYRCRECINEMQGSWRVQECVVKTQTGLGWSQRVWDWQEVLGDGSDDSGMA